MAVKRETDGGELAPQIASRIFLYDRKAARQYVHFFERSKGPVPIIINVSIVILSLIALYLFLKVLFLRLGG